MALVCYLIFTGKLVPRTTLEDMKADRDEWRTAALRKDEAIALQAGHIDQLMEVGRTAEHLIRALPPVEPAPRRELEEYRDLSPQEGT